VELFTIQCTTCRARLKVTNESAIGDILACPKCGSMVQVVPPVDWKRAAGTAPIGPVIEMPRPGVSTSPSPAKAAASQIPAAVTAPPVLPIPAAALKPQSQKGAAAAIPALAPKNPTPTSHPPVPVASPPAGRAMATTTLIAAAVPIWSAGLARAKQDWLLLGSAMVSGVLLGAAIWLAVGARTASVPAVAQNDSRDEAAVAKLPADGAGRATNAATIEHSAPPLTETSPAESDTAAETSSSATDAKSVGGDSATQSVDQQTNDNQAPEKQADDPQPAVVPLEGQGVTAAKQPGPAMKLDPAPAPAGRPTAERSDSEASTAASVGLAAEDPTDNSAAEAPIGGRSLSGQASRRVLSQGEIDDRLGHMLSTVEFTKVPLGQFVEFIGDFTNLPITFDDRSLDAIGKSRQTPISVKLSDTTAGDALRTATAKLGLTYTVRDGKLVVAAIKEAGAGK
jgi:hypothetical protein